MIKQVVVVLVALFFFNASCGAKSGSGNYRVLDLNRETELQLSQAVSDLKKNRIVLVGNCLRERQFRFPVKIKQTILFAA